MQHFWILPIYGFGVKIILYWIAHSLTAGGTGEWWLLFVRHTNSNISDWPKLTVAITDLLAVPVVNADVCLPSNHWQIICKVVKTMHYSGDQDYIQSRKVTWKLLQLTNIVRVDWLWQGVVSATHCFWHSSTRTSSSFLAFQPSIPYSSGPITWRCFHSHE